VVSVREESERGVVDLLARMQTAKGMSWKPRAKLSDDVMILTAIQHSGGLVEQVIVAGYSGAGSSI
jgi:hypothetical protein